jgi:hypothetical protein
MKLKNQQISACVNRAIIFSCFSNSLWMDLKQMEIEIEFPRDKLVWEGKE